MYESGWAKKTYLKTPKQYLQDAEKEDIFLKGRFFIRSEKYGFTAPNSTNVDVYGLGKPNTHLGK